MLPLVPIVYFCRVTATFILSCMPVENGSHVGVGGRRYPVNEVVFSAGMLSGLRKDTEYLQELQQRQM